jgi:hypothetical protein
MARETAGMLRDLRGEIEFGVGAVRFSDRVAASLRAC